MVKKFEENASPGIQNESGSQALYGLLENKSCYHQLDALFRDKANGTALFKLNISRPGMELALSAVVDVDLRPPAPLAKGRQAMSAGNGQLD
ncbi:hypothetical protein VP01_358g1, partial [Puccinia sorghi]